MFDGLKAFRGVDGKVRIFRLDRHCQRLHDGADAPVHPARRRRSCRAPPSPALVDAPIATGCRRRPGRRSTSGPTVIATEPFLGVRPAKRYIFFVIASPVGAYHGEAFAPARILVEDKYVRAAVGGLGGVKAGANYIASLRAAEDAKARGYAQVLWTDAHEHSYLEEVGTMNMVARIGDEIVTPPLGGSILDGVTRDSVITLLREWGFTVNERPLGMEELLRAHRGGTLRELFGCGTAAVITPVGTLGWKGEDIVVNGGQPGEVARRLFEAITDIQYGRAPDTHGWMTEVVMTDGCMADLLVRLYDLPPLAPALEAAGRGGHRRPARGGRRANAPRSSTGCARTARPAGRTSARRRSRASRSPASSPSRATALMRRRLLRRRLPRLLRARAGRTPTGAAAASGARCCCRRCTRCAPTGTPTRSSAGRRRSTSTAARSAPS